MATYPKYNRLSKDNAAVLLVDHQAGLLSLVNDFSPDEFRNNILALADTAKYFKLPTILTTSFEDGPNGPLMPELKAMFPDAAHETAGIARQPVAIAGVGQEPVTIHGVPREAVRR